MPDKMNRFWNVALSIVMGTQLSCQNEQSGRNNSHLDFHEISIIIYSPYSCYDSIRIRKNGSAEYNYGLGRSEKETREKARKTFKFESDSALLYINNWVSRMKQRQPVFDSTLKDNGFRFTLIVDKIAIIDKFGQDSLFDKLLYIVAPYIKNDELGDCDFFNLLKKHPDWPEMQRRSRQ